MRMKTAWKYLFTVSLFVVMIASGTCFASELDTLLEKEAAKLHMQVEYNESLDFNLDGKEDRVAILFEKNEDFLAEKKGKFWVVTLWNNKFTILADLTEHLVTEGGVRGLETELWADKNQIHYAAKGGSAWVWSTYSIFAFRQNRAQIIFEETSSCWLHTGTSEQIEYNYLTSKARQSYERRFSWEDKNPELTGESSFYVLQPRLSKQPIRVDGVVEKEWQNTNWVVIDNDQEMLTYGRKNWQDSKDLSLKVKTLLQGNNLYILAEVTDDQIVWNGTTDLKQDHLEIWLDSEASIQVNSDEALQLYNTHVYRHNKNGLYQFAIYKTKAMRYLPQSKVETAIQSAFSATKSGYMVEICIPLDRFLMYKWEEFQAIGLTLVVSDTDSKVKPAQDTLLATSTLKWGDPYSLGVVVKTEPYPFLLMR